MADLTQSAQPKEVLNISQGVRKEVITNAIVMVIIVLCGWGLVFHSSWGPANGLETYLGYIACAVPFFTVIQTIVPFINKRAELSQGKCVPSAEECNREPEPLTSIWALVLPRALVYGVIGALLLLIPIQLFGLEPGELAVNLGVLLVLLTTTTLLLNQYLPRHLHAYAHALRSDVKGTPQPFAGYLTVEHFIPFFLLQAYINGCLANRAFSFELSNAGGDFVPAAALIPDAVITFVLLALFQWMFSNNLARSDVRLGRLNAVSLNPLNGWVVLGMVLVAGLILGAVYTGLLSLAGTAGLGLGMAVISKMAVVAVSILLGGWIGIHWGGTRELALVRS